MQATKVQAGPDAGAGGAGAGAVQGEREGLGADQQRAEGEDRGKRTGRSLSR